jgi:predicted acyltransferase
MQFLQLLIGGAILFALGWWWGEYFPINKKFWTSSFVLLSSGLAMISLAVCLFVFDGLGLKRLARPFEIVGVNAIFVFVASGIFARLLADTGAKAWINRNLITSWIDNPVAASHAYAVATVAFWWLILWLMSRKDWAIRV